MADIYIVVARTGEAEDDSQITAFIVEKGTPGFTFGRLEEKMGLHASATGELLFTGCRVPAENLLGEEGQGDKLFLKTLDGGRIGIGAMALGLAQAAFEAASAYAKERRQFGRPISEFQAIQHKLVDMAMEIDAARLLIYRAAWMLDHGQRVTKESAMAKLFASEAAVRWAASSSSADSTSRMPRPPPPAEALRRTGKPTSPATSRACSRSTAPSDPGTSGTPASAMASLAAILSPIVSIVSARGPMKTRSLSSQASAKAAFSARNPQPGCTASHSVVVAAATSDGMRR